MTTLPSISELGLWGLRRHTQPAQSTLEPSPASLTTRDDLSTLGRFSFQDQDDDGLNAPIHRLPSIHTLEPCLRDEQDRFYQSFSEPSTSRRGSADSTCSTPSLAGSSASTCATNDECFSPITSQPYRAPDSYRTKFRDLTEEESHLAHLSGSDSRLWSSLPAIRRQSLSLPLRPPSSRSMSHPATAPMSPSLRQPLAHHRQKRRKPKRQDGGGQCNIKYSDEEGFFIIYLHDDLALTWAQIAEAYNERFTDGPRRRIGGLQSILYRLNKECPVRTADNLLIFGEGERDGKGRLTGYNEYDNKIDEALIRPKGKVSLVDRYAEQVVSRNWPWIQPQDMERARKLAAKRRPYRLQWETQKEAKRAESMTRAYSLHDEASLMLHASHPDNALATL